MFNGIVTVWHNLVATELPPSFELREANVRWGMSRSTRRRRSVRVVDVVQETPSTRTYVLENLALDKEPIIYRAGQHLTVLLEVDGVSHRRCYSFSTSPAAGGSAAITVKCIPGGVVSGFLAENIEPGHTLRIAEPSGVFTIPTEPDTARRFVFVAGGVGITPLISLAETILRMEPRSEVTLLYGSRSEDEIIFRRRLATLTAEFPQALRVVHAVDEAPEGWTGVTGCLDGSRVLEILGGRPAADFYYVCGPAPMMDSVTEALRSAGIPTDRVRTERFTYVARQGTTRPTQPCDVVFAASGKRITVRPDQTILEASLEAGIALEFSCTMGGCGACKVRRTMGRVVMDEPNCLTQQEAEEGWILTCCAYPTETTVIEAR